jgi:hypothetical protein
MSIEEFNRKEYVALGHITDANAYSSSGPLIP